jgi:hypothetical protein
LDRPVPVLDNLDGSQHMELHGRTVFPGRREGNA